MSNESHYLHEILKELYRIHATIRAKKRRKKRK